MSSSKFNQEVISKTEKTFFQKLVSEQSFWVSVALLGICFVMFFVEDAFSSKDNLFNITRNFSFIGIMAIGMTFVIITAGIDLSVGSIMGVTGVICGLFLDAQYLPEWYSKASYFEGVYVWVSIFLALLAGALIAAVNGTARSAPRIPPIRTDQHNTENITVRGCNPTDSPTIFGCIKNPSNCCTKINTIRTTSGVGPPTCAVAINNAGIAVRMKPTNGIIPRTASETPITNA